MDYNLTEDEKMLIATKEAESYYRSEVASASRKELLAFVKEVKETKAEFVSDRRSKYLEDEVRELERETGEILKLFENFKPYIYGSIARGNVHEESDIDVIFLNQIPPFQIEMVLENNQMLLIALHQLHWSYLHDRKS